MCVGGTQDVCLEPSAVIGLMKKNRLDRQTPSPGIEVKRQTRKLECANWFFLPSELALRKSSSTVSSAGAKFCKRKRAGNAEAAAAKKQPRL